MQFLLILNICIFWFRVRRISLKKRLQILLQTVLKGLLTSRSFASGNLSGRILALHFQSQKEMLIRFADIS